MRTPNAELLTDLYEVTMAATYFARGMNGPATFDLFVRELPPERNFLITAGLEEALTYLEELRFDDGSLSYLRALNLFGDDFLAHLGAMRFTGEVWAVPEGNVVFANEPLLRVTAPLIEAQLVETFLLNCIGFQSLIASKAARIAIAADGRQFIDFAGRRAHGPDAAIRVARAAYIGGAAGTSNLAAGREYGIPVSGTMAHSFIQSFEDESEAFRAYARQYPTTSTLLIDTYDTVEGARAAVRVARELAEEGISIAGVRLDSGNLGAHARAVRAILDEAELTEVKVVASGDLDEYSIDELVAGGAPIDSFGVGTHLGTSDDAPWLGVVYKLAHGAEGPTMKLSEGKQTIPGIKQVYRMEGGPSTAYDLITLADEGAPVGGWPLLERVMIGGTRVLPPERLDDIRKRRDRAVHALPGRLRSLQRQASYEVRLSDSVRALMKSLGE